MKKYDPDAVLKTLKQYKVVLTPTYKEDGSFDRENIKYKFEKKEEVLPESIDIKTKPTTVREAIKSIKINPYSYYSLKLELRNDPGVIANAILSFIELKRKLKEEEQKTRVRNLKDRMVLNSILKSLYLALENSFIEEDLDNEKTM